MVEMRPGLDLPELPEGLPDLVRHLATLPRGDLDTIAEAVDASDEFASQIIKDPLGACKRAAEIVEAIV